MSIAFGPSSRGTVIVIIGRVGFYSSNGKGGRVALGDAIVALNDKSVELMGVQGFTDAVHTTRRPISITVRS